MESRARCMDLTSYNYYDLLYAFHIFRNNYRKGMRLEDCYYFNAKIGLILYMAIVAPMSVNETRKPFMTL